MLEYLEHLVSSFEICLVGADTHFRVHGSHIVVVFKNIQNIKFMCVIISVCKGLQIMLCSYKKKYSLYYYRLELSTSLQQRCDLCIKVGFVDCLLLLYIVFEM